MLVSLGLAGRALLDEWSVRRAASELQRVTGERTAPSRFADPARHQDAPARAALLLALAQARTAERTSIPDLRVARFEASRTWVSRALAERPRWGEAHLVLAYVDILEHGPLDPGARRAVDASYRDSPYSIDGAPWRVRYALTRWPALDAAERSAAIDEAAWYASLSDARFWEMMALVVGSPAEIPLIHARATIAERFHPIDGEPQPDS